MRLADVHGIGTAMVERLVEAMGDERTVLNALESGDVAGLAAVEGISAARAIKLIRAVEGPLHDPCANEEVRTLHERLIASIAEHTEVTATRQRMGLLAPIGRDGFERIEERRARIEEVIDFRNQHPEAATRWDVAMAHLSHPRMRSDRFDRVIVVPDAETATACSNLGRRARLIVREASETWRDYEIFRTVTWVGPNAPAQPPPSWIVVPSHVGATPLLPEQVVEWFVDNATTLRTLVDLRSSEWPPHPFIERMDEWLEPTDGVDALLANLSSEDDRLERLIEAKDRLWTEVSGIEGAVNDLIVASTGDVRLSFDGEEVLSMYAQRDALARHVESALEDAMDEALAAGRTRMATFLAGTGVEAPKDLFASTYPCAFDRRRVEAIEADLEERLKNVQHEGLHERARVGSRLQDACTRALSGLVDLELWTAVARWSAHHRCVPPTLEATGSGIAMVEGRHLLLGVDPDPVTYGVGSIAKIEDQQSIALLSGANSGGKTTLLETLAMVALLAHAGLPVPARSARVALTEEIHLLAKVSGTQSAGALERTLIRLADIVTSERTKLVLADELEAITEPGAVARILSGLLEVAQGAQGVALVIVTHIAQQIREVWEGPLRIDGIEARGLDEAMELIVDRTPRRNHLARSTPELIVQRLAARSKGPTAEIFERLSDRFNA